MRVQFKKLKTGKNTIRCVRDDGTEEWCYVAGIMTHDLAHFAVEKEMRLTNGLYGHINTGVTFKTLASAGVTKAYSWHVEIFWSEIIVNSLCQVLITPNIPIDINEAIKSECKKLGLKLFPPILTDGIITDTTQSISRIWNEWEQCQQGSSIEKEIKF